MLDDVYGRANEAHRRIVDDVRRQARQSRMMADAAEQQLRQAADAVRDVVAEISFFERNLLEHEEARVVVIGGPTGTAIFPSSVASLGSDRIRFEGVDDQQARVTVIQHISQLNLMLKVVALPGEQARRIGFHVREDQNGEVVAE